MAFRVSERALERLEWSRVLAQLREHARTPMGREALLEPDFAPTASAMRDRLRETAEARAIVAESGPPPLGGAHELETLLAHAGKGGIAPAEALRELASTLRTIAATARFLRERGEPAPALAELAGTFGDHVDLADRIETAIDPSGEIRNEASSVLAEARRLVAQLGSRAQGEIGRLLKQPAIRDALSDQFFTVRGDRYVLPVRADSRGRVPGIVHDASSSGTTLFVEPQALVDLNNQIKQAELTIEREEQRVLRLLNERVAAERESIAASLVTLAVVDHAFARAAWSDACDAHEPEVGDQGVFRLPLLRHPLLDQAVPNDVAIGEGATTLVISGPNAGGKTVAIKAAALALLSARAGLHLPAERGCRMDAFDALLADIGDEQDLRESLSTFSAHMRNLARITENADASTLVVLDEIGVGTDPGEGAALAQAALEALADRSARVLVTTHYNLLKEMAEVDSRFENACVEFDPETLAPTYRLRIGVAGSSSASAVAARMGMPEPVLSRARALLEREDRRLDRMLAELSASRAALETERNESAALRAESEEARDAYRHKLERLQERRDQLFSEMRSELEGAFKEAHEEVAGVIRELQRGGTAQDAAHARERLLSLEEQARAAESQVAEQAPEASAPRTSIDWEHAREGDAVGLPGGRVGVLLELPDRRGRVVVQAGSARLTLAREQLVGADAPVQASRSSVRVPTTPPPEPRATTQEVDLRGQRVDEARDQLGAALDTAIAEGAARLRIIHGIGTGALRTAVREELRGSRLVLRVEDAPRNEGGDGVTIAVLAD